MNLPVQIKGIKTAWWTLLCHSQKRESLDFKTTLI